MKIEKEHWRKDIHRAKRYSWVLKGAYEFFGTNLLAKNDKGSNYRGGEYVKARKMAMAFLMEYDESLTLKQIGLIFGGKDHSTVIHHRDAHLGTMSLSHIAAYAPYKEEYDRFVKFMYAFSPQEDKEPLFSPNRLAGYTWWM